MKKTISIILALVLCLGAAACSASDNKPAAPTDAPATEAPATEAPATPQPPADVDLPDVSELPLETLQAIWDAFGEDELFPAAGGDYSEENMRMDGPGKYAVEAMDDFKATFNFPEEYADLPESMATLVHMMNLNTFSCAAIAWTSAFGGTEEVADAIADKLQNTQWICGMPDEMAVVLANGCLIYLYGEQSIVDSFMTHVTEVYPDATVFTQSPVSVG